MAYLKPRSFFAPAGYCIATLPEAKNDKPLIYKQDFIQEQGKNSDYGQVKSDL